MMPTYPRIASTRYAPHRILSCNVQIMGAGADGTKIVFGSWYSHGTPLQSGRGSAWAGAGVGYGDMVFCGAAG
jgi:hypothetical protein